MDDIDSLDGLKNADADFRRVFAADVQNTGTGIERLSDGMDNHKIGTVLLCQKMTVDLTQDIPEVTDVKFSQKISTDKTDLTAQSIAENLQIDQDGPEGIED